MAFSSLQKSLASSQGGLPAAAAATTATAAAPASAPLPPPSAAAASATTTSAHAAPAATAASRRGHALIPAAAEIPCLASSISASEGAAVSAPLRPRRRSNDPPHLYHPGRAVADLISSTTVHVLPAACRAVTELVRAATVDVLSSCLCTTTEILAGLHIPGGGSLAELVGRTLVPVRRALAVLRVVLPLAPAALGRLSPCSGTCSGQCCY